MTTQSDEGFLTVKDAYDKFDIRTQESSVYVNTPTIFDTSNLKMHIFHARRFSGYVDGEYDFRINKDYSRPDNLGGWTIVVLVDKKLNKAYMGVARCSHREPYDKKQGRAIARKRALDAVRNGKNFVGPEILYRSDERADEFSMVLDTLPSWVIGKVFIS